MLELGRWWNLCPFFRAENGQRRFACGSEIRLTNSGQLTDEHDPRVQ